jgi:hypothetical protein
MPRPDNDHRTARVPDWGWALLALVVSTVPVLGAFSPARVFFLQDLAAYYWPNYVWARRTMLAGNLPFWDPYVAFGRSALQEPTRQILFLPTLLLRLALPEALGFNLSVALAVPAAAAGCFLLLRRRVSPAAAALGAVVFATSGPMLSMCKYPNVSWSIACMPWVLWCVDRVVSEARVRNIAGLAAAIALQITAAEPVTLATTAALAIGYAAFGTEANANAGRRRATVVAQVLVGLLLGVLLATPQVFPMVEAFRGSLRPAGIGALADICALHPLMLVESIAPRLFGDYINQDPAHWSDVGFSPFMPSLYVGIGALALVCAGVVAAPRRRWTLFWLGVLVVAVVCAFGIHTPVYPALKQMIPPLQALRFPLKYLGAAALAFAALAAAGWDHFSAHTLRTAASHWPRSLAIAVLSLAAVAGLTAAAAVLVPEGLRSALSPAAGYLTGDPVGPAGALAQSLAFGMPRLGVLAAVTGLCLWVGASGERRARLLRGVLYGMVLFDLCITNAALNPTIEIVYMDEPAWAAHTREHASERVYVDGRIRANRVIDGQAAALSTGSKLVELTPRQVDAAHYATLAVAPSAWRLREAVSFDQAFIYPKEYWQAIGQFQPRDREARLRFLESVGVRYVVSAERPADAGPALALLADLELMALYELSQPLPRAMVVPSATVEGRSTVQIERLVAADFDPSSEVLLSAEPPAPAGAPGVGTPASATLLEDGPTTVTVAASVTDSGGYLVLADSYDPYWHAEVDGEATPVLQANGLFRAVRLAPGHHEVRFTYRPTSLFAGAAVLLTTILCLAAAELVERARRRQREA